MTSHAEPADSQLHPVLDGAQPKQQGGAAA
jgi:hypothetical protein